MTLHRTILAIAVSTTLVFQAIAQEMPQVVIRPGGPFVFRPYKQTYIPPVRLTNSNHLHELIRSGKLYLTVQDTLALAIENNLDLEVDRYGPLGAQWQLERLQAGGALAGVPGGNSLVNQATGGQGIAGSQATAGLSSNGGGTSSGGNAVISQIGPVTQNLDPVLQSAVGFSHTTYPQANTAQSQTASLVDTRHVYNNLVQQGFLTGGYAQLSANESYLKENTPTDILNPSTAAVAQIYVTHQFLQGFGVAVNSRFIRVAEKGIGASRETFRSQLLNVVANVLNLYWDLVSDLADLKVKEGAVSEAQKFSEDTSKQIELGVVAKVEAYRAQAQLATRRQEISISQAAVRQQENLLKNALSRNGLEDPLLDAAEVVPLDTFQVPETDDLPPLRTLLARAMANRPDIALSKISDETSVISALGTANGVLPLLRGIASTTQAGLAGTPMFSAGPADPYYIGGAGTAVAQVLRRNFPSERGAVIFQGLIGNRIAQGDYGIDQLQLRQADLVERKNQNQLVVDISNQIVGLRQARSRYTQAVSSRKLQQELLEKEHQKFTFGTSTITDVVTAQSAVVASQTAEVVALAAYSHARTSLDQVLGETLTVNHITVEAALQGH